MTVDLNGIRLRNRLVTSASLLGYGASKRRLILYDRALSLDNVNIAPETTIEQCVVEALNKLLTIGKIDVELVANATFLGDQRVLSDIGILAGQNYGEDDFGNNLALPPELSYLRR